MNRFRGAKPLYKGKRRLQVAVVDNKKTAEPANPCEWTIREMKADTLNGKEILRVTMTCCFMGEQIILDKKTNEVIGYIPSDK